MDIEVTRAALDRVRTAEPVAGALADGDARLRIERFALSTNNVTYAVFGDLMRYWEFFPAADGWGRIPVWGFGSVVESRCPGVAPGVKVFGYFPMSTQLRTTPGRVDASGFTDLAPHRQVMASVYNRYQRVDTDPVYRPDLEELQMLLYPLFFTAFLVDDFLVANADFDAEQLVLSSASSKTALGVAFQARARSRRVVGLTSPSNAEFLEGLGVYDEVIAYDRAPTELVSTGATPSTFVDVAGNRDVLMAVHQCLGERLQYSMTVGATHWDHVTGSDDELPGPHPTFFFAPSHIAERTKQWGRAVLGDRLGVAWTAFAAWVPNWLQIERATGAEAVTDAYRDLLRGRADPKVGYICALGEGRQ